MEVARSLPGDMWHAGMASSPQGSDVDTSTSCWTARCLSSWDISLVLRARSVRTYALTSKWRRDMADKCPLCDIAVDTVPHRLGGCIHPDISIKVKARHGAAVSQMCTPFDQAGMGTAVLSMMQRGRMLGIAGSQHGCCRRHAYLPGLIFSCWKTQNRHQAGKC